MQIRASIFRRPGVDNSQAGSPENSGEKQVKFAQRLQRRDDELARRRAAGPAAKPREAAHKQNSLRTANFSQFISEPSTAGQDVRGLYCCCFRYIRSKLAFSRSPRRAAAVRLRAASGHSRFTYAGLRVRDNPVYQISALGRAGGRVQRSIKSRSRLFAQRRVAARADPVLIVGGRHRRFAARHAHEQQERQ